MERSPEREWQRPIISEIMAEIIRPPNAMDEHSPSEFTKKTFQTQFKRKPDCVLPCIVLY
jgi:hypothetical protein